MQIYGQGFGAVCALCFSASLHLWRTQLLFFWIEKSVAQNLGVKYKSVHSPCSYGLYQPSYLPSLPSHLWQFMITDVSSSFTPFVVACSHKSLLLLTLLQSPGDTLGMLRPISICVALVSSSPGSILAVSMSLRMWQSNNRLEGRSERAEKHSACGEGHSGEQRAGDAELSVSAVHDRYLTLWG